MKTCAGVEKKYHAFLTWKIVEAWCSTSTFVFNPGQEPQVPIGQIALWSLEPVWSLGRREKFTPARTVTKIPLRQSPEPIMRLWNEARFFLEQLRFHFQQISLYSSPAFILFLNAKVGRFRVKLLGEYILIKLYADGYAIIRKILEFIFNVLPAFITQWGV